MNDQFLKQCNEYVRKNDLYSLQQLYNNYLKSLKSLKSNNNEKNNDLAEIKNAAIQRIDLPFLFSKLFTNACLYNRLAIAQWLFGIYLEFDSVTQIGLRQTFNYTRHIARQRQFKQLHIWLNNITLVTVES